MADDWLEGVGRSVGRSVALRSASANAVGAVTVFVVLTFLAPNDSDPDDVRVVSRVFVVFSLVAFVLGRVLGRRLTAPLADWLRSGRRPTEAERRLVMTMPLREASVSFALWVASIAVFTVTQVVLDGFGLEAVRIGLGILLGGLTTTLLTFLLVEDAMRPIFALALAGEPPEKPASLGVRPRLLLAWALGSGLPLLAVGLSQIGRDAEERLHMQTLLGGLSVTGLVAGGLTLAIAARTVGERLDVLRRALERVRAGEVRVQVPVDDGGEVGLLQAGFNRMVEGLRERERLQELFGRHVGEEVARRALAHPERLGGEQREVSALFVDVIGSTAVAQRRDPAEVVALLNAMFGAVVRVVAAEGGLVNKFEGDGALCIFGAPEDDPHHATRALRTARALRLELLALGERFPDLDAGIGVSTGEAVAGNVGADHRYEYTVIGDPVNEAARLTDAAKGCPGRVLASQSTIDAAGDEAERWTPVDTMTLRGRATPTKAYEPERLT